MNNIYVLNRDFSIVGIIDEYVSNIWRPAYYDIGDFELYLSATDYALSILKENCYVVRSSDITVVDNVTTYKNVMIIKNINIITDVENGDFLSVTGRELKFILSQRIVWKQTNINGTVEDGIRRLITENAISPTDTRRAIPNLILGNKKNYTERIRKQITGDKLDSAIIEICTLFNYGWNLYISNNKIVVELYKGLDRSHGQTERPYVVFSDEFENLYDTEYQLATEEFCNTTLIGGEGEGAARIYTSVGDENAGLDRYEIFTDANGVSQNKGSDDEITLAEYIELLKESGMENIAEHSITEGFSGEISSDMSFVYGTDFYLGDKTTVINKYGIQKDVIVLSAIESEDENGKKLIPQFNL